MHVVNFTPLPALLGGLLIGLATVVMWLGLGRITGISGITGGLVAQKPGDISWRAAFIAGLVLAGTVLALVRPDWLVNTTLRSWPVLVIAGLLVGVGTQLGSGCTSGHGICGIGRGSPRGLVATLTFMATGGLTAFVVTHFFAGAL